MRGLLERWKTIASAMSDTSYRYAMTARFQIDRVAVMDLSRREDQMAGRCSFDRSRRHVKVLYVAGSDTHDHSAHDHVECREGTAPTVCSRGDQLPVGSDPSTIHVHVLRLQKLSEPPLYPVSAHVRAGSLA